MLITTVNYCYFHSSFPEVLVHSFAISHCKKHALRCVSCRLTGYFVVRCFAAIVAEIIDYVTQVGGA